eukprot:634102-Prorocentrum_minimum.AAC.7
MTNNSWRARCRDTGLGTSLGTLRWNSCGGSNRAPDRAPDASKRSVFRRSVAFRRRRRRRGARDRLGRSGNRPGGVGEGQGVAAEGGKSRGGGGASGGAPADPRAGGHLAGAAGAAGGGGGSQRGGGGGPGGCGKLEGEDGGVAGGGDGGPGADGAEPERPAGPLPGGDATAGRGLRDDQRGDPADLAGVPGERPIVSNEQ